MLSTVGCGIEVAQSNTEPGRTRSMHIPSLCLTPEDKIWIGQQVVECDVKQADVMRRLGLTSQRVSTIVNKYRDGKYFHASGGRPRVIPIDSMECIKSEMLEAQGSYQMKDDHFKKRLATEAGKWLVEQGKPFEEEEAPRKVSRSTTFRYENEFDINTGYGESTTAARAKACGDFRNFASFVVANDLMVNLTVPQLILNSDATTFEVGYSKDNKRVVIKYVGFRNSCGENLKVRPDDSESASITAYFIKYYLLISADGYAAHPVFVVQDNNMAEGDIDVHECPGLGVSTTAGEKAYIVFVRTRGANLAFYEWFNTMILFPFVHVQRTCHRIPLTTPVWYQLDGEQLQIDIYSTPAMLQSLNDRHIAVGKPPGSTSSITQACDREKLFIGPKTALKNLTEDDVNHPTICNYLMLDMLQGIVNAHHAPVHNKEKHMKSQHVNMLKHGILRIQYAIQSTTKRSTIIDSFTSCGIYPFSFNRILDNFSKKMVVKPTKAEVKNFLDHRVELNSIMMNTGEVLDSDFDRFGIHGSSNKDGLKLNQRRFVVMTNPAVVMQEYAKKVEKLQKVESDRLIKEAKKAAAAVRKAAKEAKAVGIIAPHAPAPHPIVPPPAVLPPAAPAVGVPKLYCYCKQPYDPLGPSMIECCMLVHCTSGSWFHYDHVGLGADYVVKKTEKWYCYTCRYILQQQSVNKQ